MRAYKNYFDKKLQYALSIAAKISTYKNIETELNVHLDRVNDEYVKELEDLERELDE